MKKNFHKYSLRKNTNKKEKMDIKRHKERF